MFGQIFLACIKKTRGNNEISNVLFQFQSRPFKIKMKNLIKTFIYLQKKLILNDKLLFQLPVNLFIVIVQKKKKNHGNAYRKVEVSGWKSGGGEGGGSVWVL